MTLPRWFGPYGSSAIPVIHQLPGANANALWFHGFDDAAFDACAKHGIAACVEFKTFRADFTRHPDLIPIGVDGQPIRYGRLVQGVCLSKRDFLEETAVNLAEGLAAYQPAGVWLDYLTYAGWFEVPDPDLQESCFCPDCITDFCTTTGLDATTPAEILATAGSAWTRHKCERIAHFAAHYASIIRTALPECVVGAYMCPWTPDEFDGALTRIFAQDYTLLAPSIDVFTPLIYATKSGCPPTWAREWLDAAPAFVPADRKAQLILDVLEFPASLEATAGAAHPSWGVQIFGGASIFEDVEQMRTFAAGVAAIRQATD